MSVTTQNKKLLLVDYQDTAPFFTVQSTHNLPQIGKWLHAIPSSSNVIILALTNDIYVADGVSGTVSPGVAFGGVVRCECHLSTPSQFYGVFSDGTEVKLFSKDPVTLTVVAGPTFTSPFSIDGMVGLDGTN